MENKKSWVEEIGKINRLKAIERILVQQKLSGEKRRIIGGWQGRKIKLQISRKVQAGFAKVNSSVYITGWLSWITDEFCRLDSPKPNMLGLVDNQGRVETIKILSVELL